MPPWTTFAAVAAVLLLAACNGSDEPSGGTPGDQRPGRTELMAADDLPDGFPVDDVPVVAGRIVSSKTGEAAGAPPGKKAWAVEVAVGGDRDDAFQEARVALLRAGFKETEIYDDGPDRQSILTLKSLNVIVAASHENGVTTLWYVVGPDGLRVAG